MRLKIKTVLLIGFVMLLSFTAQAQVRETKTLKKKFGFELPKSAKTSLRVETKDLYKKSKVIFLMIEMPSADMASFRANLFPSRPENSIIAAEDFNCDSKVKTCLGIGFLPINTETPEIVDNWWKERNASQDFLVTINNYKTVKETESGKVKEVLRGTSAAILWFDTKKGILQLLYRG